MFSSIITLLSFCFSGHKMNVQFYVSDYEIKALERYLAKIELEMARFWFSCLHSL